MTTQTSIKKLGQGRTQCTVVILAGQIKDAEEKALGSLAKNLRLPGFRPGKAPPEMIREKISPDDLFEETLRALLPAILKKILDEHKLAPILPPKVEVTAKDPLTLQFTFVERPEVTLKGVEKIKVEKEEPKVDAKDVDRMIRYLVEQRRTFSPADRAAKEGDQVTMDFSGTDKEGKDVPGTKATGYQIIIGSKTLIPGFEDALIGMQKGDAKTVALTFPETYHAAHLRKQPVTFAIKVTNVEEVHTPELTDAFVKEQELGTSAEELKKHIEGSLRQEEEQRERQRREQKLLEAMHDATTVDLPPELVEQEASALRESIEKQLAEQKQTLEMWLTRTKRTPESLTKELTEEATRRLRLRFGIETLLEQKKIAVPGEELSQMISSIPEEEKKNLTEDRFRQMHWQKMVERLMEEMLQ